MHTYGLPELTGWSVCHNCARYPDDQAHPAGKLFYDSTSTTKAKSRSLLRYKYRWSIRKNGDVSKHVYSATLVFLPKIIESEISDELIVRLRSDISVVYPKLTMFEEVSNIGCEYILLQLQESLFSTSANLTATISNSGEVCNGK